MSNSLKQEANGILTALTDPRLKKEAEAAKALDPLLSFRTNILDFFQKRIDVIDELELMRRKAREIMLKYLTEVDPAKPITLEQADRIHAMLGSEIRQSAEPIIGLFRGSPGVSSAFADLMRERDPAEADKSKISDDMSPEQLQSFEKMMIVMGEVVKRLQASTPAPAPAAPPEEPKARPSEAVPMEGPDDSPEGDTLEQEDDEDFEEDFEEEEEEEDLDPIDDELPEERH